MKLASGNPIFYFLYNILRTLVIRYHNHMIAGCLSHFCRKYAHAKFYLIQSHSTQMLFKSEGNWKTYKSFFYPFHYTCLQIQHQYGNRENCAVFFFVFFVSCLNIVCTSQVLQISWLWKQVEKAFKSHFHI